MVNEELLREMALARQIAAWGYRARGSVSIMRHRNARWSIEGARRAVAN